ncbi:transcription initiation at TATA-containing promoter protein [Ciborinia camelliae]|nr:transcription initiation at TATA-containing promoter protein [Ciborinia camelliae]
MTTQHSEDLALEQKIIPVPSSDTMALDLNINGASTRDDSKTEQQTPSDAELKKSPEITNSESAEFTSTPELDGNLNEESHNINRSLPLSTTLDSHAQDTPESQNVSQLQDSNTTAVSDEPTKSVEEAERAVSDLPTPADSVPEVAFDSLAPTAVPPIVEAPESDMRDEVSPLTQVPETIPQASLPASDNREEPLSLEPGGSAPTRKSNVESVEDDMNLTFDAPRPDLPPSSPNNAPPSVDMDHSPESQQATAEPLIESASANLSSNDIEMTDAPSQPQVTKVAREREDDGEEEPSAKRTKTEESEEPKESLNIATPAATQNGVTTNGTSSSTGNASRSITQHETKEILKIIKNVIKTAAGKNFRSPVAILWPGFAESYAQKVETEVDLGTMEKKIKGGEYPSIQAIKDDAALLYENAVAFNGLDNPITVAAKDVKTSIITKLGSLPPEPPAHVAKPQIKKPKRPTPSLDSPARAPAARRPSRGSTGAAAPMSAPTFALDPVTSTPLIRRDSTKDGRPKREIHPPKNKDLPYSSVRPKSKKYSVELKWCEETLNEMKKPRYLMFSSAFMTPVDPVALQIPNYFTIIKSPMDISTVSEKLHNGAYTRAKDFEQDVKLIFQNCYKFNPEGNPVRIMGQQFEELFNGLLAKKDRWIADHQPVAATPERDEETEEEEESEDEPEPVQEVTQGAATARLVFEQEKLIDMLSKPENPDVIALQRKILALIKEVADEEEKKLAASAKKPTKKSRPAKPTKKAAPAKKAAVGPPKKSGGARKEKYMGSFEKEVIAAGIGDLPDHVTNEITSLIRREQPETPTEEDGTMELDIELVPTHILWKLYEAVHQNLPHIEAALREARQDKQEEPRVAAKPAQKKKNKPMSKMEQERKIQLLKDKVQDFNRGQGSASQEPIESVEQHTQEESSGDESSDSEEE